MDSSKSLATIMYRGEIGQIYKPINYEKEYRIYCSCGRKHDYESIFQMMNSKFIKPSVLEFKPIILLGSENRTDMPMFIEHEYDYDYVHIINAIREELKEKYDMYYFNDLLGKYKLKLIFDNLVKKYELKYIIFLLHKEYDFYKIVKMLSFVKPSINYDDFFMVTDICYIMNFYKYDCLRCRNDIMQFYSGVHVKGIEIKSIKAIEILEN